MDCAASDIVALTLDDVEWRARRLRIQQRKTGRLLWLPLTDEVATALLEYLRRGRPHLGVRRSDAASNGITRDSIGRSFSDATRLRACSSDGNY